MDDRTPLFFAMVGLILLVGGFIVWLAVKEEALFAGSSSRSGRGFSAKATPSTLGKMAPDDLDYLRSRRAARDARDGFLDLEELKRLLGDANAIPGEAILTFASPEAYERFVNDAKALGFRILGFLPQARALRVGYDSLEDFYDALSEMNDGDLVVSANYLVSIPDVPPEPDSSEGANVNPIPFGGQTLSFLGVRSPIDQWGSGVRIAVLDSGVVDHSTFGPGQVRTIDFGVEASPPGTEVHGHGTAVASLVGGNDPGAPGLAPGGNILSYAVTNADGFSDSFTLSQAIYHAVDHGADIINISLGSFGNSRLLSDAIAYAVEKKVAVVAAAGNEDTSRLAYPAAYAGVISVGAIDAAGQHVYYSNTGETLSLSAPGVGVYAAWPGNEVVYFSGTSASAPYVSGAIAAVLSSNPGLDPIKASQLVMSFSNEAGRPGMDSQFGSGILNIGRVMDRNVAGIYDVAVASQTFSDPVVSQVFASSMIDVAFENRGTEPLYNVQVKINSSGTVYTHNIGVLAPGKVSVKQAPVDPVRARAEGSVQIRSEVQISDPAVRDRDPRNNVQTTVISIAPPAEKKS